MLYITISENVDYDIKSGCRAHTFFRKLGLQKQCAYIRILENSANETKCLSVSLSTSNPHVVFNIQNATIFIMDASTTLASNTSLPTEMPTTSTPTGKNTVAS